MSALVQQMRHWLTTESVGYECRNCGTTLDVQRATCPACGADDTACYDLD